jgi:hypothetical protein
VVGAVAVVRISITNRRLKEKQKEQQPYTPQFDLITNDKKDRKS